MALTKATSVVVDTTTISVALVNDTTVGGVGPTLTTHASNITAASTSASQAQTTASSADTRSKIYDIASGTIGKLGNAATIVQFVAPRTFTLPAGLTGSFCKAGVAAAGAHSYTISKNGASIGTMNFAAGAASATLSFASVVTFVAGDIIAVAGPATADTALSNLSFTIAATLS
jgi:WD40 repeat protein